MNCVIPGLNVKVLGKGIQALAKIGDELFIEAKLEKLTFLSFNRCKTVCAQFHLLDSFFSQYDIKENEINEQSLAITCKIHMKTVLPIFKGTHLEKKLDFMKIEYESNSDLIKFKVKYKCDDIILTHNLHLMDPETLTIKNYPRSGVNTISAASNFYNNLLTLFSSTDDDIILEVSQNKVIVRNYCVGLPHKAKFVRSQVSLNYSEFSVYQVNEETTINFSLKPFRTAIQFADALNLDIGIYFDKGGKPLSLVGKNTTFEIIFIVATLNPYSDGQSTCTGISSKTKNTIANGDKEHNITSEDLEALVNENWDDFDVDDIYEKSRKSKSSSSKITPIDLIVTETNVQRKTDNPNKKQGPKNFTLLDVIPKSPESPRVKKAKLIFKRSFDHTYIPSTVNTYLPGSDSE